MPSARTMGKMEKKIKKLVSKKKKRFKLNGFDLDLTYVTHTTHDTHTRTHATLTHGHTRNPRTLARTETESLTLNTRTRDKTLTLKT